MAKSKKNKNKPKLNLTVRDEQRNKLEQMASLENRSVSNLIEVMADERWERLAEQQGVAYAKTVAEAMNLKVDMDNPTDREKLRRAILDLVAGEKCQSKKGMVENRKKKETRGRKSKLTPELIAHLCAHISNGALCNQRREFPRKVPRSRHGRKSTRRSRAVGKAITTRANQETTNRV